mmetsp:Transcript_3838/g.11080  ORF Transcript_3838/g.11080 Transcript_3838/m.11080 type:complete len:325 (-) Transcript_3838:14-988(-)
MAAVGEGHVPAALHPGVVCHPFRTEESFLSSYASFKESGFVICEELISSDLARHLVRRLDAVLDGTYDTGRPPDKWPSRAAVEKARSSEAGEMEVTAELQTLQIINIWKADRAFRELAVSPAIGRLVASLGGWSGARLAQDQVWYKPPGAGPLVFHRDTTYFEDFSSHVITVWIALDLMDEAVGALEYVAGSHTWGDARRGSAKHFFDSDRRSLVNDAARREGLDPESLRIVPAHVRAGGAGVHNGRTWHGSGPNASRKATGDLGRSRRGVGLHFVPAACDSFRPGVVLGRLWKKYVPADGSNLALPPSEFPVTFSFEASEDHS